MTITITFDTAENCAAFAGKTNTTVAAGAITATVGWEKLALAKAATGATGFAQNSTAVEHFIVKGTVTDPALNVTVIDDLGNGFYHITTDQGLAVANVVTSLDPLEVSSLSFAGVTTIDGVDGVDVTDATSATAQWARIRVGSNYRPLQTSYEFYDQLAPISTPELFIIDSGINWSHPEFAGRAHEDLWKLSDAANFSDEVGHGTMVASAAAGVNLGVARDVKLFNLKIATATRKANILELGQAIDAVIAHALSNPNVTRIVNASWGVPKNTWLEHKFQQLLDAGICVIAAAGNSGIDVAAITPAGMADVITVGAIDRYDIPAGFNNISPSDSGLTTNSGMRLDLFAPGDGVVVAKATGGYATVSGTSFAAGYVTGSFGQTAALRESLLRPALTSLMLDLATPDALLFDDARFSENQNKLISVFGNKPNRRANLDLYLGAFNPDVPLLTGSFAMYVNSAGSDIVIPDATWTYSIEFENAEDEPTYSPFMSLVATDIVVDKPTVSLPAGETLKMVRFRLKAQCGLFEMYSPWMFFFHTDPSNTEDLGTEVTLALTETNSTSFFASWTATQFLIMSFSCLK